MSIVSFCKPFTDDKNDYQITPIYFKGEFVFLPQEVEKQLGIENMSDTIRKNLGLKKDIDYFVVSGDELADLRKLMIQQGMPNVLSPKSRRTYLVRESGLLAFFFRSNKDEHIKFRIWITNEVIPALIRDGQYAITQTKSKYDQLASNLENAARLVRELEKEDDIKWNIIKDRDETINSLTDEYERSKQLRQIELKNQSCISSVKKAVIEKAAQKVLDRYKPLVRTYAEAYNAIYKEFERITGVNIKKLFKNKRKETGMSKYRLTDFLIDNGYDAQWISIVENMLNIEDKLIPVSFDDNGEFVGVVEK